MVESLASSVSGWTVWEVRQRTQWEENKKMGEIVGAQGLPLYHFIVCLYSYKWFLYIGISSM